MFIPRRDDVAVASRLKLETLARLWVGDGRATFLELIAMNKDFLALLQNRIASTSVGPSTARGMGPEGTVDVARDFLRGIDLGEIMKFNRASFQAKLDDLTEGLRASLPRKARYWGSSRKFLNIFLRGVLYNRYLCERYDLYKLEPWLEVPLDSHVAKGLHLEKDSEVLPKWRTVIGLSPDENGIFQEFAETIASLRSTCRVHLDLWYWRGAHLTEERRRRDHKSRL